MTLKYLPALDAVTAIEDRTVRAWVSREAPDRMGDVVIAAGMDLSAYQRNPVVLWAHDHRLPPIGKGAVRAVPGEGIEAETTFASTPFAQEILDLYRDGFLKAFSVGFRTVAYESEQREGKAVTLLTTTELVEYSAVPVPANPDALVKAAVDGGSDAAALILRVYYPEAKDNCEAARIASDIRRLTTAAESLVNITRHYAKHGLRPVAVEALTVARSHFAELLGADPCPATLTLTPPPEPDPAAGEPSEAEIERVRTELAEARKALADRDAATARAAEVAVATLRRRYIGGRR